MTRFLLLLRHRARRDILQLALWILGTVALAASAYTGVRETFGTEQDRTALLAAAIANPVILLFRGLPSGSEEGAFIAFLILPFLALLAAFMSSFLAVRHTRADEELDRAELVAATPAGRVVPLVATVAHGVLANAVLALLVSMAFLMLGLGRGGSILVGVASGVTGIVFLGFALLAAQLVHTARAANAVAVWAILLSYLACGIGNALGTPRADLQEMESAPLAWFSPFGWAENTRPFDADDPRPLVLSVLLAAVCAAAAGVVQARRDLGGSLLPERLARSAATRALSGPWGLSWRLSRGAMLGWAVAGLLVGMLSTRLSDLISRIGATIPSVQALLASLGTNGTLAQDTVTIFFTLTGVLAACAGVQTVVRARQEEVRGTAEPVRAAAVGPVRWLAGYLVIAGAAILATVGSAIGGAILGLSSLSDPDWSLVEVTLIAGLGQVAAAAVFGAAAAVVFVVAPRLSIAVGWTLIALATVVGLFGPLLGFPDAVVNLSPIAVTPVVSGSDVDPRGLWWLVTAAVAGTALALALMRRRQLAPAE